MYNRIKLFGNKAFRLRPISTDRFFYGMPLPLGADCLIPFSQLIRKHGWPKRSAYAWKDDGLFPHYQINRIILVRESEVMAGLELFRRVGRSKVKQLAQGTETVTRNE